MIAPAEIESWYAENAERLATIEKVVRSTLERFASTNGFLFAGRIKTLASLAEKIETGRVRSWADIDDAYAATVVIPTYSRESEVRELVRAAFVEKRVIGRGETRKQPGLFRFDSTRVYCCLSEREDATEAESLTFEVQILSAFDYAWQAVTHDLVFKNELVDWRRARLAAQMKALVEQLDAIGEHFDVMSQGIAASAWIDIDVANEITEWINGLVAAALLPEELKPAAPNRTAETMIATIRSDGCGNDDLLARARRAIAEIQTYLEGKRPDGVPRSLSFTQIAFGVMFRSGVVSARVRQRIFLNEALVLEFPELRAYQFTFEL